jgi:hypothetical protein
VATERPADSRVGDGLPEHRGLVALRVYEHDADAAAITIEVEAMALVAALPALLDLATLDDGRTCVVVERLSGPTLGELSGGSGLTAGQAVTILAPLAIAVRDLERHGFAHVRLALSDVMLDETGRARVIGTGGLRRLAEVADDPGAGTALVREMVAAFARLVGEIGALTRPAGVLDPVVHLLAELLATRPFRVRTDEIERMLFAIAEPAPVSIGPGAAVHAPAGRRHRSPDAPDGFGVPGRAGATIGPEGATLPAETRCDERRRLPSLSASFDSIIGETIPDDPAEPSPGAAVMQRLRVRLHAMVARRRPVLLVGGLAGGGALVLALTLLPPSAEPRAAGDDGVGPPVLVAEPAGAGPAPGETDETDSSGASTEPAQLGTDLPGPSIESDAATATAELLRRRERCFETLESTCLDGLVQSGSALETADRGAMAAAQAGHLDDARPGYAFDASRIIGEMGGASLVEVPYSDGKREPASILVMRSEAGWRLREIFG